MIETPQPELERGPFLLHRNKGREHYEAEEYARARRDLELAHRIDDHDPDVMFLLGMTYFRLDQHREAEAMFRELIAVKPDVPSLHVNRGIVLFKMDRQDEAEAEFQEALALGGAGNRPHLYLGLTHARRGEFEEALQHFEQSGAEVMASRMREKLGAEAGARLEEEDEERPSIEFAEPDAEKEVPFPPRTMAEPQDLEEALGAATAGPSVSNQAVFTPYGEGLIQIAFRGLALAHRALLVSSVGNLKFERSAPDADLVRALGDGSIFLAGHGRRLSLLTLRAGVMFHVEVGHFAACEGTLSRDLLRLGPEDEGVRAVALQGEGIVALSTGGSPVVLDVDADSPVSVVPHRLVGWTGSLEPSLVRWEDSDGESEDLQPPMLRFRGRGRVILDHGEA